MRRGLKACFKCMEPRCGKQLTISNYATAGTELLCKTHYFERFAKTGKYAGGEQFAAQSGSPGTKSSTAA